MPLTQAVAEDLESLVERSLSQPPSRVGLRLRPEQEIADALGVSRWRLRSALDKLEQKGFLTRKRGSGTYVRKLPSVSRDLPEGEQGDQLIGPEQIFADAVEDSQGQRALATESGCKLQVGLFCDLGSESRTSRAIHSSIIRRFNASGHRLIVHSSRDTQGDRYAASDIARMIEEQACDGFVVEYPSADAFLEASELLGISPNPVFFGTIGRYIRHQPVISFGGREAVDRTIGILAGQGFNRIAMVYRWPKSPPKPCRNEDALLDTYRSALAFHDLSYNSAAGVKQGLAECAIGAMHETRKLFEQAETPDAIFVADDHLLPGVLEGLRLVGRTPGQDVGLITACVRGQPLPQDFEFSRIEFDAELLGQVVADTLLREINSAGAIATNMLLCGTWRPGQTHQNRQSR